MYSPSWVFENVPLDDKGHYAVVVAHPNVGAVNAILTGQVFYPVLQL